MADRTIYCSACGTAWAVPAHLTPGRRVRCRDCYVVFAVPELPHRVPVLGSRPDKKGQPDSGTPVRLLDIAEFPTDLREAIGPILPPASEPDPSEAPTNPSLGAVDRAAAERRAFDLDARGDPLRRTGAGIHRVPPEAD